jgi:hypothetical protein
MDILKKNMSKIPGDNGSSLNKLIRIKIIAFGRFRVKLSFFECVAEVRDSPNSIRIE